MSLSGMLDSSVTAIRPAVGQGALLGTTQDFTLGDANVVTVLNGVAASYQEASAVVQAMYAQMDQVVTNTLMFVQDPGDLIGCKVIVTRLRIGDSFTVIPRGSRDPIQMGQTWVWPVDCERKRQP